MNQTNNFVNIDHKYFCNLSRKQIAFIVFVNKLNKARRVATNYEIADYLGITKTYVHKMIDNINLKIPNILKRETVFVNRNFKIKNVLEGEIHNFNECRNLTLTRELHQNKSGLPYLSLPEWIFTNKAYFLNSNELSTLAFFKSLKKPTYTGFLTTVAQKVGKSLSTIKRALITLKNASLIKSSVKRHLSSLKKRFYTTHAIRANNSPVIKIDHHVIKKIPPDDDDSDDSAWELTLHNL